jgi:hypothetical protein
VSVVALVSDTSMIGSTKLWPSDQEELVLQRFIELLFWGGCYDKDEHKCKVGTLPGHFVCFSQHIGGRMDTEYSDKFSKVWFNSEYPGWWVM